VLTCRLQILKPMTITIADISGKVVYTATEDFPLIGGEKIIDTKGWSSGAYIVRMEADGISETKRIVVIDK
jgi:hypothetical protein